MHMYILMHIHVCYRITYSVHVHMYVVYIHVSELFTYPVSEHDGYSGENLHVHSCKGMHECMPCICPQNIEYIIANLKMQQCWGSNLLPLTTELLVVVHVPRQLNWLGAENAYSTDEQATRPILKYSIQQNILNSHVSTHYMWMLLPTLAYCCLGQSHHSGSIILVSTPDPFL